MQFSCATCPQSAMYWCHFHFRLVHGCNICSNLLYLFISRRYLFREQMYVVAETWMIFFLYQAVWKAMEKWAARLFWCSPRSVFQLMRSCWVAVVHWLACESTAPKSFCPQLVWVEEKEEGVKLLLLLMHCVSVVHTYQNKLFELLLLLLWLNKGLQTTTLTPFQSSAMRQNASKRRHKLNSCLPLVCVSSVYQPIWTNLVKQVFSIAVSWFENFAFLMMLAACEIKDKGLSILEDLSPPCSSARIQKDRLVFCGCDHSQAVLKSNWTGRLVH